MVTISLLVTGKTELHALADSLSQVFPADFRYANNPDTDPEVHLRGFTSRNCREILGATVNPESDLGWFAARLVAEAYPGRTGDPPDLVFGIDDVELFNTEHPEVVVQVLRDAVRAHVERSWSGDARKRVYQRLREHCSFHLLMPMVEAYFFGEPVALDRTGRAPGRICRFDREDCDPEQFLVGDPDYLAIPEPQKKETRRKSVRRREKQDWRRSKERRPRHPKKYVQFLCDELGDGNTTYNEADGGVAALRHLAWEQVLRRSDQVPYIRALFVNIARMVLPRPAYASVLAVEPACATWPPSRDNVLRNI